MSAPPPIPPAPPVARPGNSFVTVLAWVAIAAAGFGVFSSAVQLVLGLVMPADYQLRLLSPYGGELPTLPPSMAWYYAHPVLVAGIGLAASALLLWASWGLLKRRESARRGFIALVVVFTACQLGMVALVPDFIAGSVALQAGALPEGQAMPPEFAQIMDLFTWVVAAAVLALAVLHAWIVWKLCTASIREEFATRGA
jgi:hypothetical protein